MMRALIPSRLLSGATTYLILGFWLLFCLFPIAWLVQLSLKNRLDAFAVPPKWIFEPTFVNYQKVLFDSRYLQDLTNSLIVSGGAVLLALLIGVPAAYTFSRIKFRGRVGLFVAILIVRMTPGMAFVIPYFALFRYLSLLDTYLGLILIYLVFNLALVVWSMSSFFNDIPKELDEAAEIDGATTGQTFFRVILPLSTPGLTATAITCFILSWNEFLYALILTRRHARTAPVGILDFTAYEGIDWGQTAAGAVLLMVPVVLFAILVRRYMVAGLMGGAVKE